METTPPQRAQGRLRTTTHNRRQRKLHRRTRLLRTSSHQMWHRPSLRCFTDKNLGDNRFILSRPHNGQTPRRTPQPQRPPELERWMTSSDAIVLGPGIGVHEETVDVVKKLLQQTAELNKPMVLDADA